MSVLKPSIHQKIYFYTLLLIAISMPFQWFPALSSIAFLLLFANFLLEGQFIKKWKLAKQNQMIIAVFIFYLLHIIGYFYSSNLPNAIFDLKVKLPILASVVIIPTSVSLNKKQFHIILQSFLWTIIAASLTDIFHGLYQNYQFNRLAALKKEFLSYHALSFNLQHANYMGMYINMSIGIMIHFLYQGCHGSKKILYILLSIYLSLFVFMLESRMQIIILILICFIGSYFFLRKKINQKLILILLISVISGTFLILKNNNRFNHLYNIENQIIIGDNKDHSLGKNWDGFPLRVAIWKCAVEPMKKSPWIGYGIGDLQEELRKSYIKNNFRFAYMYGNMYGPHNQYIETCLALGLLGLMCLFYLLIYPAYLAIKYKNILLITFLLITMMSFITEASIGIQKGVSFFAFFLALLTYKKES